MISTRGFPTAVVATAIGLLLVRLEDLRPRQRMVFLGFGKYVRADRIYALEPILGEERGGGRRTLVWVEGIDEPLVASRTERTILQDMGEDASVATSMLDDALALIERIAEDAEKIGPLLARSIKAESGVDLKELGKKARDLLEQNDLGEDAASLLACSGMTLDMSPAGRALGRDFFAAALTGRRGADRRHAPRRRRRRHPGRARDLRRERPGQPQLPRADAAERLDVRAARPRLRLPLLRRPLVPELRLLGARRRARFSSGRSSRLHGIERDDRAPRQRRPTQALRRAGQSLPGARGQRRPRRPAARPTALRAAGAGIGAGDLPQPAHRNHAAPGERPWRLCLAGSRPISAAAHDESDGHSRLGGAARPRPLGDDAAGVPGTKPPAASRSPSDFSFARAWGSVQPDDVRHEAVDRLCEYEDHACRRRRAFPFAASGRSRLRAAEAAWPACISPGSRAAAGRAAAPLSSSFIPITFGTSTSFGLHWRPASGP